MTLVLREIYDVPLRLIDRLLAISDDRVPAKFSFLFKITRKYKFTQELDIDCIKCTFWVFL